MTHALTRLHGHPSCITALTFLEPWPLLASADACGEVRVWSTMQTAPDIRFKQLLHLKNQVR